MAELRELVVPPMLGAALECARHELPVYPARPRNKNPLFKGWQRAATTKAEYLTKVWRLHPEANVGIACRGLVVLDADSRRGQKAVEDLALPETTTVRTRRGSHRYFLGNMPGARTTALPDVELRGKGQGVLGPGSIHPSGFEYEWEVPPWEAPPVPLPDAIRDIVVRRSAEPVSVGHKVFPGSRHEYLLRTAASLRTRHGVGDVARILREFNLEQCDPPLEDEEVERMAREGAKLASLPWLVDPYGFCTQDTRLSMPARATLWALCRHADSEGKCFPGMRRLAAQLGCRPSTVTAAIRELERFERIEVDRGGPGRSNRYRILPWSVESTTRVLTPGNTLTSVTPPVTPTKSKREPSRIGKGLRP